jgi:hypothetical protein
VGIETIGRKGGGREGEATEEDSTLSQAKLNSLPTSALSLEEAGEGRGKRGYDKGGKM